MSQRIDIALIQSKAATNKIEALEATVVRVAEAAQSGAKIVCLQELFNLPYFCVEQDIEHFDLAEPLTGPTLSSLAEAAAKHSIYLIVPFFEAVEETAFYNSAVVFDPNGNRVLHYRKMHIPQDPGFEENSTSLPGILDGRFLIPRGEKWVC
jgi:N-carbamoylputrescine amidase